MAKQGNEALICYYGDLLELMEALKIDSEGMGRIMIAWWQWADSDRTHALEDVRLEAVCVMLRQQTRRDRLRRAQCSENGKRGGRPHGGAAAARVCS